MKSSLFTLLFVCSVGLLQAQNVVFNDANFKAALVNNSSINTNGDSEIQLVEALATQLVSIPNLGITDLTGIEEFTNVTTLFCGSNSLTTVDLRNLTNLSVVTLDNNQLTSLQIATNNSSLTYLDANNNQLTNIDLTAALNNIVTLDLSSNQLTSIDISSLDTDIREVYLDHNQLTSIILPVNIQGAATDFRCDHNQLATLNMTMASARLNCGNNPMDSLWIQSSFGFGSRVDCDSNQLVYINVVDKIDTLVCSYNNLTDFNLPDNHRSRYIDCSYNSLDSVNIVYSSLRYLNISHNQLNRLIISSNGAFNVFPLDASNNPNLECILTDNTNSVNNAIANWTIDNQTSISDNCRGIWSSVSTIPTLPNVNLYPNPTTNNVQLDLGQIYEEVVIVVYNNLGQELYRTQQNFTEQIHVHLPKNKGIYITKVQTEKGQAVFKVIKE